MSSSDLHGPKNDKMFRDYSFKTYLLNQDTLIKRAKTLHKNNFSPKITWKTMDAYSCNTLQLEIEGDLNNLIRTDWIIKNAHLISSNNQFAIIQNNGKENIEAKAILHYLTFSDTLVRSIMAGENTIDVNLNEGNYLLDFENISSLSEVAETRSYRGNKHWSLITNDQSDNQYASLVTEKEDLYSDSYLILPKMNLTYDGLFANISLRYILNRIPGSESVFTVEVYKHCGFDVREPIQVLYTSKQNKKLVNNARKKAFRNSEEELKWENLSVTIPKYILNEKDIHFVIRFHSYDGNQKFLLDDIAITSVSDPFRDYYKKEDLKFQIYPSPIIDYGTINILSPKSGEEQYKISLFDQQGNEIFPPRDYHNGESIDFSSLRAGVYIAKIVDVIRKSVGVEKVVKGR